MLMSQTIIKFLTAEELLHKDKQCFLHQTQLKVQQKIMKNSNLAGETEAGGHTRHGGWDEVVQITVRWSAQFQRAETNVIQCLVVDAVRLVSVFNQLMDWQSRIVRLNDCVWYLHNKGTHRFYGRIPGKKVKFLLPTRALLPCIRLVTRSAKFMLSGASADCTR